jgi:pentatricopeptide repeat protein
MVAFSQAVSYVRHSRYQVCILGFIVPLLALSEVAVFVLSEVFVGTWQKEFITMLLVVIFFFAGSASGTRTLAPKQVHQTKDAASEDGFQARRQGRNLRGEASNGLGVHGVPRSAARFPTDAGIPMENIDEAPRTPPKKGLIEQMLSDNRMIDSAQREGFTLDASNFPALFAACARQGNAGLSITLFKYMLEKGIVCDRKMVHDRMVSKFFNVVSESLDDQCLQEAGVELIEAIRAHGLAPTSPIQNRLMRAWKSKPPDHIVQVFMTLKEQGVSLCPTVYRCILVAYERAQPQLTLDLCDEMLHRGVKFDRVAFNAALCACSILGRVNRAVELYKMMPSHGLVPNGKTYGTLIRVYTAADMVKEALNLFESMRAENIEPNRYSFGDAIYCYVKMKMPRKAISLYKEMVKASMRPCDHTIALYQEIAGASKASQDRASGMAPPDRVIHGVGTPGQPLAARPAGPERGSKITVLSPSGMQLECTVVQVDTDRVRISYEGLDRFQVEWLPKDSNRIVIDQQPMQNQG